MLTVIQPGKSAALSTYDGHEFFVTDATNSRRLATFHMNATKRVYTFIDVRARTEKQKNGGC